MLTTNGFGKLKKKKKGKSEWLDSCDWPNNNNLTQALCIISKPLVKSNWSYSPETPNSGQNGKYFVPCDLEIWWMTFKNNRAHVLCYFKLCASFHGHQSIKTGVTVQKCPIQVKIDFFVPCDLEILWMTLKNHREPLLCYFKLCASFDSHQWIQTGVTVQKRPIRVKTDNFLAHVTLKFDGCPWKTMGHLSYATSSFVHYFIAICEFKMELQSRNG